MGNYAEQNSLNKSLQEKLENPVNLFLESDLSVKELSQNTSLNESDRRSENRSPLSWVSSWGCWTDRDTCWPNSSQMFPSSCADYLYKTPFLQPNFYFLRIFDKMGLARRNPWFKSFLMPRCRPELRPGERLWDFSRDRASQLPDTADRRFQCLKWFQGYTSVICAGSVLGGTLGMCWNSNGDLQALCCCLGIFAMSWGSLLGGPRGLEWRLQRISLAFLLRICTWHSGSLNRIEWLCSADLMLFWGRGTCALFCFG